MSGSPDTEPLTPPSSPLRTRRGRPPVSEPRIRLSTRVPLPLYDTLCRAATVNDMPLSSLVCELLKLYTRPRT